MKEAVNQNLFAIPQELQVPQSTAPIPSTPTTEHTAKIDTSIAIGNKDTLGDDTTVEVRFCTGGRLSAPPILHFRDYSMLASQALSEMPTSDDHLPVIIKVLNSMVVEDFDCGLLHIEEAKEVLFNIHAKWWGNTISGFKYLLDPDIKDEEKLVAKENISVADIPLESIAQNIVPLASDIKEPINIKVHGTTVRFIYPRMRNSGVVEEMLKIKFANEEQKFNRLKQLLAYNSKHDDPEDKKDINLEEAKAYDDYLAQKAKWRLLYMRAQEICGIDNDVFTTFDERVKALEEDKRISIRHWQKYTDFLEGKGAFGIKNEAEFYSDVLGKKVVRPFRFYTWSFIPTDTLERTRDGDATVSFG